MSADLPTLQDELSVARSFVECAYLGCEGSMSPGSERSAICAVLNAAMMKLEAFGGKLSEIRGAGAD